MTKFGVLRDLLSFMKAEKKYWLVPIIVALLLLAVIAVAAQSALAPFVYTLF